MEKTCYTCNYYTENNHCCTNSELRQEYDTPFYLPDNTGILVVCNLHEEAK